MPAKKYRVKLSKSQRESLQKLTTIGKTSARELNHARILLYADESSSNGDEPRGDEEIASLLGISSPTVSRIRKRFVEQGLECALKEKPRPGQPLKYGPGTRAKITALACSDPPEGHARWTLRLLADKLVELDIVESISHNHVREVLKKMNLSLT